MPKATKKFDESILNIEYEQDNKLTTENEHKMLPNNGGTNWIDNCTEFPEDFSSMFDKMKSTAVIKKKKAELATENTVKIWQNNFSNIMKKLAGKRKHNSEALLNNVNVLALKLETDTKTLEENDQRIMEWHSAHAKIAQQTAVTKRQKTQFLKKIHAEFIKECEEMESAQQQQSESLESELARNMLALQERLQTECRRRSAEAFRRAMSMMIDS